MRHLAPLLFCEDSKCQSDRKAHFTLPFPVLFDLVVMSRECGFLWIVVIELLDEGL